MKTAYSEYNNRKVILENLPRQTSIFPQVREIGYITGCIGLPLADRIVFQDKLEFCIRIANSSEHLIHTVNEVKYDNTYPHCLIKTPLGTYRLQDIAIRDVFYIIYPSAMLDYFKKNGVIDNSLCWDIELTPTISHLIVSLKEMLEHPITFGMTDRFDQKCLQLIQELVLLKKSKDINNDLEQNKINQITAYFQVHYCDDFSLDELIEQNGFSRSSFFRNWAKYNKISPAKYITKLRIEEAKRILAETGSPVEDVAHMLKFSSVTYFCAAFKNVCGCTPLQYRMRKRITIK